MYLYNVFKSPCFNVFKQNPLSTRTPNKTNPPIVNKRQSRKRNPTRKGQSYAALNGGTGVAVIGQEDRSEDEEEASKYCICKRPASEGGAMVACDNVQCVTEWFHVQCMGLDKSVLTSDEAWYCPTCREKLGLDRKE